jgi:hypothetical protein
MGARETKVSEEETAAVRRDGELLASASRERRQGVATAAEHLAAGELSAPPQEGAVARGILQPMPRLWRRWRDGERRVSARCSQCCPSRETTNLFNKRGRNNVPQQVLAAPADPVFEGRVGVFQPRGSRRIIRAARVGPEGSLNAICLLDDDITLFMHAFPDADDRELRAQCRSTLLEYKESMRAWEEARDAVELDSSITNSENEGELTGDDLLWDLERPSAVIGPAATLAAQPSYIDWSNRVLRQTIYRA